MNINICKECKHYQYVNDIFCHSHLCARASTESIDPITGQLHKEGLHLCDEERKPSGVTGGLLWFKRKCGPEGKHFVSRGRK